jgi:hypothetical protein
MTFSITTLDAECYYPEGRYVVGLYAVFIQCFHAEHCCICLLICWVLFFRVSLQQLNYVKNECQGQTLWPIFPGPNRQKEKVL